MDATNDAIVGTAINYNWYDIQSFAVSLSRSGFKGRKVMFVSNVTDVARKVLTDLDFELIDFTPTMKNVVIERFRILHDWIAKEQDQLRYVVTCDVRDVVIQDDPSPWMEKQTATLFGATESIVYKQEACNPMWVEQLYGKQVLNGLLANEDVICAGTIAGKAETVKRLALRIFESSTDRFGDDQAALNYLLRTEFKYEMRIPAMGEGFILTAGWWLIGFEVNNGDYMVGKRSKLRETPPDFKDGVAYPQGQDKPFCIVHQYERGNRWAPAIALRYIPDFSVEENPALIVARQHPTVNTAQEGIPIPSAKLVYKNNGLTLDWWDTHKRI